MNTTVETLKAFASLRAKNNNLNGVDWFQWMLDNGQEFTITKNTFEGPRMEQGQCFKNATELALRNPKYIYCEGKVSIYGVAIDHAWVCDQKGNVIDPTLVDKGDDRVAHYFGVPFTTSYLRRSIIKNGYYGLLDGFYARETIRPLLEGKVKRYKRRIGSVAGTGRRKCD